MDFQMLDFKQKMQLIQLCREFQPHLPFNEVVFMELVTAAREYCDCSRFPFYSDKEKRFKELFIGDMVEKIKGKYYFYGIKTNGKSLTKEQYLYLHNYIPRIKMPSFGYNDPRNYRPIEKILFVKIVRACRDYMRAKMNKDAEAELFTKLNTVYDAMRK